MLTTVARQAWWWVAGLTLVAAIPQSNYNLQNLDVELEGLKDEGIPEFGTLDGVVTELGKILYRNEHDVYFTTYTSNNHNYCCLWTIMFAFYCFNYIHYTLYIVIEHHRT